MEALGLHTCLETTTQHYPWIFTNDCMCTPSRPLDVSDVSTVYRTERTRVFKQFVHQLTYPLHRTLACWCITIRSIDYIHGLSGIA